jgi:hypothetical protein
MSKIQPCTDSGVGAAFRQERLGLSDNWVRHVENVREKYNERGHSNV